MSLVLNVEILGEFKKLTAATQGANSQLSGLSKSATRISKGINKAFAAIGVGLSFRVIVNELKDAAQAATEDRKSMDLLALAMENTGKATDATVASAEAYIRKMQFSAGVADDQLRPAYQKLFIATGDVTKSNNLLSIALDASAATGKNLDVVTQAMAKSLAGNDAALAKLIPSLKGSKTPIEDMAAAFAGAAQQAANLDPYAKMQVIFGEMQEQIGMALLPTLDKFSTWLATPEGQEKLQGLIDLIVDLIGNFTELAGWVIENKDWVVPLVAGIGTITTAWNAVTVAINAARAAQVLFAGGTAAAAGGAVAAAAPWAAAIAGTLLVPSSSGIENVKPKSTFPAVPTIGTPVLKNQPSITSIISPKAGAQQTVNININKGNVNATDIKDALDTYYRTNGTKLTF